jgi:hypothetical protein
MYSTKIKEKIETEGFLKTVHKYKKEQIECSEHTFFRLNEQQRKIYTSEELKKILLLKKPFLIGLQYNNNVATFYRYNQKILKMILSIETRKVNIVTFYFIQEWQIPEI